MSSPIFEFNKLSNVSFDFFCSEQYDTCVLVLLTPRMVEKGVIDN